MVLKLSDKLSAKSINLRAEGKFPGFTWLKKREGNRRFDLFPFRIIVL
jgi:hypothetical protein